MDREEALRIVRENVTNDRIVLHMIAVSAIMRELLELIPSGNGGTMLP